MPTADTANASPMISSPSEQAKAKKIKKKTKIKVAINCFSRFWKILKKYANNQGRFTENSNCKGSLEKNVFEFYSQ